PTACAAAPSVGPGAQINIPAGCSSGGGVPTTTGVPTGAGTVGQVVSLTDGGPGAQLYGYVGQYDTPYVANYGVSADPGATAAPAVPMQRTIVQGDLLVAFISCCNTVQWSVQSGWTSIYANGCCTPAAGAAYKVAGPGDVGTTITPFALGNSDVSITVVEVANFNTGTPIVQSANSSCLGGVAANDLVLLSPNSSSGGQAFAPHGSMPTPWIGSDGGANNQIVYGIPVVPPVYNGADICTSIFNGTNFAGMVEVGAGSSTINLWLPI